MNKKKILLIIRNRENFILRNFLQKFFYHNWTYSMEINK